MAKLPLRALGLLLLCLAIVVPGCQALFYSVAPPSLSQVSGQVEG